MCEEKGGGAQGHSTVDPGEKVPKKQDLEKKPVLRISKNKKNGQEEKNGRSWMIRVHEKTDRDIPSRVICMYYKYNNTCSSSIRVVIIVAL